METVFRSRDFRPSGAQPAADPDVAGLPVEHLHLSRSWTALLGETIENRNIAPPAVAITATRPRPRPTRRSPPSSP